MGFLVAFRLVFGGFWLISGSFWLVFGDFSAGFWQLSDLVLVAFGMGFW